MPASHLIRLIVLSSLCALLGSCKVKKIVQDNYIETVTTLIEPKAHHHTYSSQTPGEHHYSTFSFLADSAGQKTQVKADYDAGTDNFFYNHAKAGDMFEVAYKVGHPHHFKVFSEKPYIDPLHTDTVVGKIINLHSSTGFIEFEYSPKNKEHNYILKKWQDIHDSLDTKYPDVKNESLFPVVYSTLDSTKAIMWVYSDKEKKLYVPKAIKRKIVKPHASRNNNISRGNNNNERAFLFHEVGYFYTPIASNDFWGEYIETTFYYSNKFSCGYDYGGASGKINDKFSYPISQSKVDYNYVGLVNQYEFLQKKWIVMNVSLTNGYSEFSLSDTAKQSPTVATNKYYLLEPGGAVSIRLFSFYYLTLKAKYRFLFGKTEFGTKNQFENYSFGISLTFRV
ncbi:MAG TPA: hypothetical protein VF411_14565 [Bacteroidia bacterium]